MRRQIGGGTPVLAAMLFLAASVALAQTEQGGEPAPNVDPPANEAMAPPMPTAASHPPPTVPQHVPALPPGVGPGAAPPPGAPAQAAPQADAPKRLGRQFPTPVQPPAPSEPPQVHVTVIPSSEPSVGQNRLRNGGGGGGEGGGLAEDSGENE